MGVHQSLVHDGRALFHDGVLAPTKSISLELLSSENLISIMYYCQMGQVNNRVRIVQINITFIIESTFVKLEIHIVLRHTFLMLSIHLA
jgi:hypothetical protein